MVIRLWYVELTSLPTSGKSWKKWILIQWDHTSGDSKCWLQMPFLPSTASQAFPLCLADVTEWPHLPVKWGRLWCPLEFSSYSLYPTKCHSLLVPLFWQFLKFFFLSWHVATIRNNISCPLPILALNSRPQWISSVSQNQHKLFFVGFHSFCNMVLFCFCSFLLYFSSATMFWPNWKISHSPSPFPNSIPVDICLWRSSL